MAITEQERLEMHLGLRKVLGDDVANTVMAHLPPSGWGDVARKHDVLTAVDMIGMRVDAIDRRIEMLDKRMDLIEKKMDHIEKRLDQVDKRMDHIERRLGIITTVGLTFGLALLALQVQIMLSLAG